MSQYIFEPRTQDFLEYCVIFQVFLILPYLQEFGISFGSEKLKPFRNCLKSEKVIKKKCHIIKCHILSLPLSDFLKIIAICFLKPIQSQGILYGHRNLLEVPFTYVCQGCTGNACTYSNINMKIQFKWKASRIIVTEVFQSIYTYLHRPLL